MLKIDKICFSDQVEDNPHSIFFINGFILCFKDSETSNLS